MNDLLYPSSLKEKIALSDPDSITGLIIGAAIEVHRHLGPGLLESTYEACLAEELSLRGLGFETQKIIPVLYKGKRLEHCYRLDMVVADQVILELKAVEELIPLHEAQLLTYLKSTSYRKGLLINFNVRLLRNGIKRMVL